MLLFAKEDQYTLKSPRFVQVLMDEEMAPIYKLITAASYKHYKQIKWTKGGLFFRCRGFKWL